MLPTGPSTALGSGGCQLRPATVRQALVPQLLMLVQSRVVEPSATISGVVATDTRSLIPTAGPGISTEAIQVRTPGEIFMRSASKQLAPGRPRAGASTRFCARPGVPQVVPPDATPSANSWRFPALVPVDVRPRAVTTTAGSFGRVDRCPHLALLKVADTSAESAALVTQFSRIKRRTGRAAASPNPPGPSLTGWVRLLRSHLMRQKQAVAGNGQLRKGSVRSIALSGSSGKSFSPDLQALSADLPIRRICRPPKTPDHEGVADTEDRGPCGIGEAPEHDIQDSPNGRMPGELELARGRPASLAAHAHPAQGDTAWT
jgi:hypothetical protein